ncbi:hypothetical protein [Marinicella sp. W31]|uniref:hypothetical protein n=1 Tax=Marinicella sp. W31 TaxID=3023713 RepID=UPI003757F03C
MQAQAKNRLSIIALFLLFLLPVVTAIVMNSSWVDYKPGATKNKGQLVEPPVLMSAVTQAAWVKDLEGVWTLVYRHAGECEAACAKTMSDMHTIRLTMGHKADKLRLLVLADGLNNAADVPQDVSFNTITEDVSLVKELNRLSAVSLGQGQGMYIVAPEGYLMMSYTPEHTPPDMIKDLKLLLKRKGTES